MNICFPLLDEVSFRQQWLENKERISPALLACLYAHTMAYWQYSPALAYRKCPDIRFIWNLANDAVYSELHLSPGMSIIKAIVLNVGGLPTTSLIGNGVLLGSAVSVAYSLGLNRNPMSWEITHSEKCLRMKIWWTLLIHDRWWVTCNNTFLLGADRVIGQVSHMERHPIYSQPNTTFRCQVLSIWPTTQQAECNKGPPVSSLH